MRWTFRISFLLFLAWAIFMVSPFVALYDLSKAVEARDIGRITERVNFNALRASLARQILGEYLKSQDLDGLGQQAAAQAGTAVLNPVLEELITPQAVIDLLDDGQLQQVAGPQGRGALFFPVGFDASSLENGWRTFIFSESQGFRSVTIPLPPDEPKERQFKITLRLSGTTWRLTGIELPDPLREELIKRATAATKSRPRL
ncbi:DUF2939 domain-containing protein [Microvirga terrae]|uniref:DUF2939 domain-containing protein n=1 Tax=Microvirga terrae TaxID=2740529 RepID=A0ABY5RPK7_9HYPH|nr:MULTISPECIES: DUF2939 domain-containing protein [Microvirga]MBQ0822307.1 DUF2939 domain-containing protein [Microvirga sp. HBU67558]UVF18259.1 DUF2939 domain-containing protein [Microvirga terrae]